MRLQIERGKVLPFAALPARAIALDGYCQGPALDVEQSRYSFDHHDNCWRMLTRATCQQVLDALLLGFSPEGFTVFLNDIDGDTALSVWLLQHPERASEPRVRLLVESVGAIDAQGPSYPPLDEALSTAFYRDAMRPEGDARRSGAYATLDLGALLEECTARITALLDGTLPASPEKEARSYRVVRRGASGWALVEAEGYVFDLLYRDGISRAISFHRLEDGSISYTVGKRSDLVPGFPVGPASRPGTILHALAAREPGWGGGSSIGGAPRHADGSRSRLAPEDVFAWVEALLGA